MHCKTAGIDAKNAVTVGLVLQKSHINTKDECHYTAVISELEARGAKVAPPHLARLHTLHTHPFTFSSSPHLNPPYPTSPIPCTRPRQVVCIYSGGLDFSGPVDEYFYTSGKGRVVVDSVINLTGFALVGGPASQVPQQPRLRQTTHRTQSTHRTTPHRTTPHRPRAASKARGRRQAPVACGARSRAVVTGNP